MNRILADLIRISNAAGKDPAFVQGGGGNTSIKTDDGKFMYIKASGTSLKDMSSKTGWRRMDLGSVLSVMRNTSIAKLGVHIREKEIVDRLLSACDDNITGPSRPSVEAHLHAFLGKCVIHLHSSAVGAYVNAKNGKAKLEKIFKDLPKSFLWVPYADPGYMLAKKISGLTTNYQKKYGAKPQVLFLQKHGLFISTSSPSRSLKLTRQVIAKCNCCLRQPTVVKPGPVDKQKIRQTASCIRKAFRDASCKCSSVSYFTNDMIASFIRRKDCRRLLTGVLTPDELLYSNGPSLWLGKPDPQKLSERISSIIDKGQRIPVAFLIKGQGLFTAGSKKIAVTVRDVVTSSLFIRTNADRMGGIDVLNKRQRDFIDQWESEAFRKSIADG